MFDRSALLELRRAARLRPILRPASRDQIRDRAVRQRPSIKSSEAPQGRQQRLDQSDKLPTSCQSLLRIRPARPSTTSSEPASDTRDKSPIPGSLQINLLFTIFAKQAQNQNWSVQTLFLQKTTVRLAPLQDDSPSPIARRPVLKRSGEAATASGQ